MAEGGGTSPIGKYMSRRWNVHTSASSARGAATAINVAVMRRVIIALETPDLASD